LIERLVLAAGNSRLAIEHRRLPMYICGVQFWVAHAEYLHCFSAEKARGSFRLSEIVGH
jgi:hypothetical protein